jgi:hypothetical protein
MKAVERRGELITYDAGARTTPDPDLTRELERAHVTALEQFQAGVATVGAALTERRARP